MFHGGLREFFLLERAEREVAVLAPSQRGIMLAYAAAAERRLSAVASAAEPRTAVVAAIVLRDGVGLLVRALVASRTPGIDDDTAEETNAASELERLFEHHPSAPHGWQRAVEALATRDSLYLDLLGDADLLAVHAGLVAVAAWLRARVDTRSTAYLRGARGGRLAALGVVVLYFLYLGVLRVEHRLHPNLALHALVTQSSSLPGSAGSGALVDGEHEGLRGPELPSADIVHTNREPAPWAMVDLGAVRPLHEVRIYNRMDHNFDDGLPYALELSEDGRGFQPAGRRTVHFGGGRFDPPWKVDVRGKSARFVRVSATGYLALSEVEVY
jgi:hypothetical protein